MMKTINCILAALLVLFLAVELIACSATSTGSAETEMPSTDLPLQSAGTPPLSYTPTTLALDNHLTWQECRLENREYYHVKSDIEELTRCFNIPLWGEIDRGLEGERIEDGGYLDFRLQVGADVYETHHLETGGCCQYQLLKNGLVIVEANAPFITYDPNRGLWKIEGTAVWELAADPPMIYVNGEDFNQKFQLDGSYYPYEIHGKLIFIGKRQGKFRVVYDGQMLEPEFDEISMAYCCAKMSVARGEGAYWFIGRRADEQFVIRIE